MAAVLLIEDVAVVRTTLMKFLERGGHAVTVCEGSHEAWRLLNQQRFDAVVTDIWMKDGDGLDLIGRIRARGDTTPIVVITGGDPRSPQSTSVDAAIRAGANQALMKPVTKTLLLDTVTACLQSPGKENDGQA
ncbi:response regulator [Lichenifustis flavocetrariae]|uniref:Response regulator n=1 Tax=Lichenifustis flavocetrariae TaxID=2949735 RepID=A0AA41Z223_9HYPH|nr:response regulator [Lichenifustis flavocetrariae]MCW6511561.1 response regulator [Lichenifustis flavocetrariae]